MCFSRGSVPPLHLTPPGNFFCLKHSVKYPLSENKHQKKKKTIFEKWGAMPPLVRGGGPPPGKLVLAYVTRGGYRLHRVQIWTKSDKNYGRESAKSVLTLIRSVLSEAEHFCTIFFSRSLSRVPWFRIYIVFVPKPHTDRGHRSQRNVTDRTTDRQNTGAAPLRTLSREG